MDNKTEILQAEAAIQKLVEEISRYSSHSKEAEAAVDSIKGATRELISSREILDKFSQKTHDVLQKNTEAFTSEAKVAATKLVQCVDQENKENDRLSQTNNQLQELIEQLNAIAQGIKQSIEENRLSLAEKLQSLEGVLTPFKDTTVKQETTLSEFGNNFIQLKENLGNVQKSLSSTIQILEQLPIEIKSDFCEIDKHLTRNEDTLKNALMSVNG